MHRVSEPASGETTLQLTVTRGPGIFGRVTVDFELQGTSGLDDITPAQGQLVFNDQVSSQTLTLTVLSDSLPEPDEVFTVVLTTPGGGATLARSNTQASVTILANDSPLRWSQAQVEADESRGSVRLTILRGQLEDGSSAGDLSVPTTVQVSTMAGSATSSDDFNPLSLTITFPAGFTSQTVSIAIVDDSIPEGDETFTVALSSPSADAVIIPASTVTVIIPINDNAGGLVAFVSPGPVVIQEDGVSGTTAQFVVQRTVGTLSSLVVEWEVTNNFDGSIATADFQPARGNVTIPDGQSQVPLMIQAVDDSLPEEAEGFMVRLVRVAQGEGDLSDTGVRVASLIVAESDDVYGLVEWVESSSLTVTSTLVGIEGEQKLTHFIYELLRNLSLVFKTCSHLSAVFQGVTTGYQSQWRQCWYHCSGLQHCLPTSWCLRPTPGLHGSCSPSNGLCSDTRWPVITALQRTTHD